MKLKQILALSGVVLLVGLFVLSIILAVTGAPVNYLMAAVFSMVFIPVIMFSMGLMARVMKPSEPPEFMKEGEQEADLENEGGAQEKQSAQKPQPSHSKELSDTGKGRFGH